MDAKQGYEAFDSREEWVESFLYAWALSGVLAGDAARALIAWIDGHPAHPEQESPTEWLSPQALLSALEIEEDQS